MIRKKLIANYIMSVLINIMDDERSQIKRKFNITIAVNIQRNNYYYEV